MCVCVPVALHVSQTLDTVLRLTRRGGEERTRDAILGQTHRVVG